MANTPDDIGDDERQTFHVGKVPAQVIDAATLYLEGAGLVATPLRGDVVQSGDDLVVHYGRMRTRVRADPQGDGSDVEIRRWGRAPLEETRRWVFGLGIVGFVLAWGLSWYNSTAGEFLSPLVTITFFLLGIVAAVVLLYVIDRSLEARGASLCRSLEDAIAGDPMAVLEREVDGLERSSAIANGVLFYTISLLIEFIVFVVLLGPDSIREAIDEAVTLDVMRAVFAIPIAPAALFGVAWFFGSNRLHAQRLAGLNRTE